MESSQTLSRSLRNDVWRIAESYYPENDWAHGRSHVKRVVRNALIIGRDEGANLVVVELAAVLHDILVSVEYDREKHSSTDGFRHEIEGAMEAKKILEKLRFAQDTIDAVAHCIQAHRKRSSGQPQTLEAKCLFDADKLDCIGAIGVIRAAFVSFEHGQEVYRRIDDLEAYKERNIRNDGTIIDYSMHSSNLEYELSLKHVAGRMYTETGKRLAKERAQFMDVFYARFSREMEAGDEKFQEN